MSTQVLPHTCILACAALVVTSPAHAQSRAASVLAVQDVADSVALVNQLQAFGALRGLHGRVVFSVELNSIGDVAALFLVTSTLPGNTADSMRAVVEPALYRGGARANANFGLEVAFGESVVISARVLDRRPPELRNRAELGRAIARASRNVSSSGEVHVKLLIDDQGRVVKAEVQKSSGFPGLDQAAIEAARTARFSPCTADGAPIQCWIVMPLVLSR
jgi:TonB family protein